jgi:hypothetical protein
VTWHCGVTCTRAGRGKGINHRNGVDNSCTVAAIANSVQHVNKRLEAKGMAVVALLDQTRNTHTKPACVMQDAWNVWVVAASICCSWC